MNLKHFPPPLPQAGAVSTAIEAVKPESAATVAVARGATGKSIGQLPRADPKLIAEIAMVRQQLPGSPPRAKTWQVYIVRCQDGSYYTGITTDLARRIAEHNSAGGGARYTRSRQPVKLVYAEAAPDRSAACRREYQLKRLTPAMKRILVSHGALPPVASQPDTPAVPADENQKA